jgi:hypothetical protein
VIEPIDELVPRARPDGWSWLAWLRFRRGLRRDLRRWARRELRDLQRATAGPVGAPAVEVTSSLAREGEESKCHAES